MTSQKNQIQALINKIDDVLRASGSRQSSPASPEGKHQEQVLEQARNYLASLQNSSALTDDSGQRWTWPTGDRPAPLSASAGSAPIYGSGVGPAESAQQVLQAIVQEMNYLRVNMMQPLREELMALYQQRQIITADIQRLEQQRHQLLLSQQQISQQQVVNDFLQSLMGRIQEQLAVQIAQSVVNLELHAAQMGSLEGSPERPQLGAGSDGQLTPAQRLQQMQTLQAQSDEMLLKMDSTLRVVFDSLQTNLESYQDSLGQGLEKMHGLGKQGEAMFAALVNRLAEQLGRGASYYLQSSIKKEWELPGLWSVEGPEGVVPPRQVSDGQGQSAVPDKLPEDQIDKILDDLESDADVMTASLPLVDRPASGTEGMSGDDSSHLIDELLDDLEAGVSQSSGELNFDLDDVELLADPSVLGTADAIASFNQDEVNFFRIDDEGVVDQVDDYQATSFSELDELDADLLLQELSASAVSADATPMSETDELARLGLSDSVPHDAAEQAPWSDEDDEALAFLDQVADAIEHDLDLPIPGADPALEQQAETTPSASFAAQDEAVQPASEGSRVDINDEIDEFYQMFDAAIETPPASIEPFMSDRDSSSISPNTFPSEASPLEATDYDQDADVAGLEMLLFETGDDLSPAPSEAPSESQEEGSQLTPDDYLFSELDILPQDVPSQVEPDRIETISTLADLIDDAELQSTIMPPVESEAGSESLEGDRVNPDAYIKASPDESLIVTEDGDDTTGIDLQLDSKTLRQLASDLSGLEGIDESEVFSSSASTREDVPAPRADDAVPPSIESSVADDFLSLDHDFFGDEAPIEDQPDTSTAGLASPPAQDEELFNAFSSPASPDSSTPVGDRGMTLEGFASEIVPNPGNPSQPPSLFEDRGLTEPSSLTDEDNPFQPWESVGGLSLDPLPLSESPSDLDLSEPAPAASPEPGMTVDELFTATPGSNAPALSEDLAEDFTEDFTGDFSDDFLNDFSDDTAEEPDPFDPLNPDDIRQIFEDLKALDYGQPDVAQATAEQTLMDLMREANPPSLPSDEEGNPAFADEGASGEADGSWDIFDDLDDPGASSQGDEKKNRGS